MNTQTRAGQPLNDSTRSVVLDVGCFDMQDWMNKLAPDIWQECGTQFEFDIVVRHYPGQSNRFVVRWYIVTPIANGVQVSYRGLTKNAALHGCTWMIHGTSIRACEAERLDPSHYARKPLAVLIPVQFV